MRFIIINGGKIHIERAVASSNMDFNVNGMHVAGCYECYPAYPINISILVLPYKLFLINVYPCAMCDYYHVAIFCCYSSPR